MVFVNLNIYWKSLKMIMKVWYDTKPCDYWQKIRPSKKWNRHWTRRKFEICFGKLFRSFRRAIAMSDVLLFICGSFFTGEIYKNRFSSNSWWYHLLGHFWPNGTVIPRLTLSWGLEKKLERIKLGSDHCNWKGPNSSQCFQVGNSNSSLSFRYFPTKSDSSDFSAQKLANYSFQLHISRILAGRD